VSTTASETETLYKFCSIESAKRVLSNKTIRWSAPYLLRDPLELDHRTRVNLNTEVLVKGAIKTVTGLIFAREPPKGNAPLMAVVRRWRDEDRFHTPEEAEHIIKDLLWQLVEQRQEALNKVVADWQEYTKRLRMCCFCSHWDNLVDWQLQGRNHTGVVLRFQLTGTKSFGEPKLVQYSAERPVITTLKEQLGIILTGDRFVAQDHFPEKFLTKAATYKPQQEVRCFYQLPDTDPTPGDDAEQWFTDREFEPDSLKAVYFGLNTSVADKQVIWDLAKKFSAGIKLHTAKLMPGKYELEADKLSDRPS
jgi:hypothetical protein